MRMVDGLFASDHLLVVGITELEGAGEVEGRCVEDDGSSTDARRYRFVKRWAGRAFCPAHRAGMQELVSKIDSCFLWPFAVSNG